MTTTATLLLGLTALVQAIAATAARGGRRRYPEQVLDALGVVRTLRSAGFGIAEIRDFMAIKSPGSSVHERLAAARTALAALQRGLDERDRSLAEARALLRGLEAELDLAASTACEAP